MLHFNKLSSRYLDLLGSLNGIAAPLMHGFADEDFIFVADRRVYLLPQPFCLF
jgi:hypothetical protein